MAFFGIPTRGAPGLGFGATKIVGRKEEEDPTEYKAPEYNLKRIKALTQEQLAPTTSGVRRAIQRVQAGRFQTPTARKEALRGAIRGGGEALGAAQATAISAILNFILVWKLSQKSYPMPWDLKKIHHE